MKTLPERLLRATYKAQNAIANASVGLELAADNLEDWLQNNSDRMDEGNANALDALVDKLRHVAEQVNDLDTEAMEAVDDYAGGELEDESDV